MSHTVAATASVNRRPSGLVASEKVVVAVVVAFTVVAMWVACTDAGVRTTASTTVQVKSGDTLWSIAQEHPVAGESVTETVDRIATMNGIEDAVLVPGTHLSVPCEQPAAAVAMR